MVRSHWGASGKKKTKPAFICLKTAGFSKDVSLLNGLRRCWNSFQTHPSRIARLFHLWLSRKGGPWFFKYMTQLYKTPGLKMSHVIFNGTFWLTPTVATWPSMWICFLSHLSQGCTANPMWKATNCWKWTTCHFCDYFILFPNLILFESILFDIVCSYLILFNICYGVLFML